MDVIIIDYKMSNLHSVVAACKKVGLRSEISSDPKKILDANLVILPGVGSFKQAMINLKNLKLETCIHDYIDSGKIFIGICLGLQLLFTKSEEFGNHPGLNILEGEVKKFNFSKKEKIPIPHMNWNSIKMTNINWDGTYLKNNFNNDLMYFVHSYFVVPEDKSIILSETSYGSQTFCSSILKKNIFATQFHPEKSSINGLKIYKSLYNCLQ